MDLDDIKTNGISERIFETIDFEKKSADDKKHLKVPNMQSVKNALMPILIIIN